MKCPRNLRYVRTFVIIVYMILVIHESAFIYVIFINFQMSDERYQKVQVELTRTIDILHEGKTSFMKINMQY